MQNLRQLIRLCAYLATYILPRFKIIVLRGFPSFEDNLLAIYSALIRESDCKIVWVVEDPSIAPPISITSGTRIVKKGGILDYWYSMTAKTLFITHGHFFQRPPYRQTCVNLWHGIPFKAIGRTQGGEGRFDTYSIASSDFVAEVFSNAFGMPIERMLVTGQARTDRMLNAEKLDIWRRAFPEQPAPEKLLLWMPTFRESEFSGGYHDGGSFNNVFNCSDFSETEFNSVLQKNNAVCLVKPHPMAVRKQLKNKSNIIYIDEAWLHARRTTLYELVGASDCLISDISSIVADFMLLDRPIILLFEDLDLYGSSRGFSFSPITDYLPANVATNFSSFVEELETVLAGHDPYAHKRNQLKKLFFTYDDAGSANRILNTVFKKPNAR